MKIRAKLNRKVKARSIFHSRMRKYLNRNWALIENAIKEALEQDLFINISDDFMVWDERKQEMVEI